MAEEENQKNPGKKIRAALDQAFARIGTLTRIQRLMICVATLLLMGGSYYYFIYAPKAGELELARAELKNQEEKLETFKIKARSLKKFEKQMDEAQEAFDQAMKALPDKKELPSLLVGISKAGGNAGLEFLLFQPEAEVNKEFYKEIPLSMTVSGTYHQAADFFFQVAGLNRIVNIRDLAITSTSKDPGKIQMKCSAVTYMFAEQSEEKKGKGKKGKQ